MLPRLILDRVNCGRSSRFLSLLFNGLKTGDDLCTSTTTKGFHLIVPQTLSQTATNTKVITITVFIANHGSLYSLHMLSLAGDPIPQVCVDMIASSSGGNVGAGGSVSTGIDGPIVVATWVARKLLAAVATIKLVSVGNIVASSSTSTSPPSTSIMPSISSPSVGPMVAMPSSGNNVSF